MLLDDITPVYQFHEVHSTVIRASPSRVFRAIKDVTIKEMPLFSALMIIRTLPGLLSGQTGLGFTGGGSFFEQAQKAGFVVLAEAQDQEVVIGRIGQFWKIRDGLVPHAHAAQDFLAFNHPGFARATFNFFLRESRGSGKVRLSTETRVYVPEASARRKFTTYWRVIYPGSALIRRTWLQAIRRRAESGVPRC